MSTSKIPLPDLLSSPRDEFLTHVGGIYEKTPWVAENFYDDELASTASLAKSRITNVRILCDELKRRVDEASDEKQLLLLNSHPDLCHKMDKLSKEKEELTAESQEEQRRAGLGDLTLEERAKFDTWNEAYKAKFGFPFILAVRNATKYTVLSAMEGRSTSSSTRAEEMACALSQVHKIAWMRLLELVGPANENEGHGGFLTCHVLDTANGSPAAGMRIELFQFSADGSRMLIKEFVTNADGRLPGGPALSKSDFRVGTYEWVFYVGDYFASRGMSRIAGTPFLDVIPLRFGLDDPTDHYHVPLLVSPWSYSTYRGS